MPHTTMPRSMFVPTSGEVIEGGIAFLSIIDIWVEITSPFAGVSEDRHIPVFALPWMQYEQGGSPTTLGQETALRMLWEIYAACLFCETHEDDLIDECQKILDLGNYGILRQLLEDADCLGDWFLLPIFFLVLLLTDWELVRRCQDALHARFERRPPEDLVRRLLANCG